MTIGALSLLLLTAALIAAADSPRYQYRVLATNRTSTMGKEMNEAAGAGFRFMGVMGGQTGFGAKEVVVVMGRPAGGEAKSRISYKLLATSRTGAMQKEMDQAAQEGFDYVGQTVFESALGAA